MSLETVETDLLAAIAAEPDAIEPRLIYADWLQARNEPRGELIVVQAGRLAKPDDVQLEERERELTTQLTDALIAQSGEAKLHIITRWHLGFVDALHVSVRDIRHLRTTHREWFSHPAFACVRELDIKSKYARNLRAIRHLGLTNTVRRLAFGAVDDPLTEPVIDAIVARAPKLTALELRTSELPSLAALAKLPLRELALELRDFTDASFRQISEVPWKLDTFSLETERVIDADRVPILAQLYNGMTLGTVKHFIVRKFLPTIDVIDVLATSKRVASVEKITADLYRAPYEDLNRLERHRKALAHVTFAPVISGSAYYDAESCAKVGSLLNYRLDRAGDALPIYEQALKIRPEDTSLRHNLGVALRKLKRFDESLIAFDTIINNSKRPTASMFNGRHYTLCELGRRADAMADLERAIAIDPNFADAWNNIGVERQYSGDAEGALAAFRRCMELNPEHGYALRNEADLLLELGLPGDALPVYERVLAQKVGDPAVLMMMAYAQIELGSSAAARATLDARFADPSYEVHNRMYIMRALALRQLDNHAAARADLDTCANETDCPSWFATTVFVRHLDERPLWTKLLPASATTPRELQDAVMAYAKATRPTGATAMHDASVDDQLDIYELAVAAALLARDRGRAIELARAAATLYVEQGPNYFRKWWQTIATLFQVAGRELDEESRALLSLVERAVRGRARIADVLALGN